MTHHKAVRTHEHLQPVAGREGNHSFDNSVKNNKLIRNRLKEVEDLCIEHRKHPWKKLHETQTKAKTSLGPGGKALSSACEPAGGHFWAQEGPQGDPGLPTPWSQTCSPQKGGGTVHFCCFSHAPPCCSISAAPAGRPEGREGWSAAGITCPPLSSCPSCRGPGPSRGTPPPIIRCQSHLPTSLGSRFFAAWMGGRGTCARRVTGVDAAYLPVERCCLSC